MMTSTVTTINRHTFWPNLLRTTIRYNVRTDRRRARRRLYFLIHVNPIYPISKQS